MDACIKIEQRQMNITTTDYDLAVFIHIFKVIKSIYIYFETCKHHCVIDIGNTSTTYFDVFC